ncbi:MAG: hypothetical protein Q9185_000807 [Variospora sp. 1 TL-2023]
MTGSILTSTSNNPEPPPEPSPATEPQSVQHETSAHVLDTTSVKTCDIESQSVTESNLSSATFDEETGVQLALNRIKKALRLRGTYRPRNKIRAGAYQRGYSTLAAIEDSDPNFLIYRKFGWLRNRLLLDLQDELVTLEQKLQLLDDNDARLCDPEDVLISCRNDKLQKTVRQELLTTIRRKLLEYDEVLLHLQQIQAIRRPTARNQASLFRIMWNNKLLVHEEMEWISRREDLAALARDSEHGWFNGFIEDTLHAISHTMITFIFRDPYRRKKAGKMNITLLSPKRFEIFMRTIFVILTTILFLAPVFLLLKLQPEYVEEVRHKQKLQLVTVLTFTLIFSTACSIFTKAKRQEIFMATGAYCAVLVVFLGNTQDVLASGRKNY